MLPDDLELVGFGDYRQPAPCAMKLTDGIYILNHALLAIVAVIFAFEVDNSDALSYLVWTFALLFCLGISLCF
jgi:protein-S-isoprenylcysteine O-methyltransferase Ste14